MQHGCRCGLAGLMVVSVALLFSGCGDDLQSPTSPSSSASSSAPADTPPGLTLSALALGGSSVLSQQSTEASITLTGAAPAGGAMVRLSSSNTDVAKVPANVMVASGASEARFTIDAATVAISTPVTINASYAGATRSTSLMVRPPAVEAVFTVRSTSRGRGACGLGPSTGEADCVLDGSASIGPVERWAWSYWTAGSRIGHVTTQPGSSMNLASRCGFFEGGRGAEDQSGDRYVQMQVELVVQDRESTRSAPVRQSVRMYPNRLCGFNY